MEAAPPPSTPITSNKDTVADVDAKLEQPAHDDCCDAMRFMVTEPDLATSTPLLRFMDG
jgi:hypothetical protein